MAQGWVKLHRSITENWLWEKKPFSEGQAWVDLLLMANHAEKKIMIGSEPVMLQPGTVIVSERNLMKRWGWGNTRVRNFIKALENDRMVSKRTSQNQSTLTIENYTIYQEVQSTDKAPTKQSQSTDKAHNKNVKNVKNDNNNIYISFKPPTVEEVRAYCTNRNNTVNAETFVSFYESKGWYIGKNKMKDWKAAVRTWEKNNRQPIEPKKAREEWDWLND